MLALPVPDPILPRASRHVAVMLLVTLLLLFVARRVFTAYNGLMLAVDSGSVMAVRAALDGGADVNGVPESQEDEGVSPLSAAAAHGKADIVRLLIDRGADVNMCDCWETPLTAAAENDRVEVIELLIERGAQVNDSEERSSALWRAAVEGKASGVRVLLGHGANPNSYLIDGGKKHTLLQVVEEFHYPEVARLLREAGGK